MSMDSCWRERPPRPPPWLLPPPPFDRRFIAMLRCWVVRMVRGWVEGEVVEVRGLGWASGLGWGLVGWVGAAGNGTLAVASVDSVAEDVVVGGAVARWRRFVRWGVGVVGLVVDFATVPRWREPCIWF